MPCGHTMEYPRSESVTAENSPRPLLPWPGRLVLCLLAGLAYTALIFGIPLSMTGQGIGDLFGSSAGDFTQLNQVVESSIGEHLNLRSQVCIGHRVHWRAESSASGTMQEQSSSLEISVWIPRVQGLKRIATPSRW